MTQNLVYAYDAFASYNSKDSDVVEEIARLLEDVEGLTVWKDNWELSGGDDWLDALPAAISRSRGITAFVGANGLGPWHRQEIKIALMRAINDKSIRLIPVALPGAPQTIDLPEFARTLHIVNMRTIDRWSLHNLRCAICGAKPGRRDEYEDVALKGRPRSKLLIDDWSIENTGSGYLVRLRAANTGSSDTLIITDFVVRTHQIADHPIEGSLARYLAPIGVTKVDKVLRASKSKQPVCQKLKKERYLSPREVEDIEAEIEVPIGIRCVVSFGLHWHLVSEPLYRLVETGFTGIGQRGRPGAAPEYRSSYSPGQHNIDIPQPVATPDWPEGWPNTVTLEDWKNYGAGEELEHDNAAT